MAKPWIVESSGTEPGHRHWRMLGDFRSWKAATAHLLEVLSQRAASPSTPQHVKDALVGEIRRLSQTATRPQGRRRPDDQRFQTPDATYRILRNGPWK